MFFLIILAFFIELTLTFTAVPSGFNNVWYSSSLDVENCTSSGFPNPNNGSKRPLPKIGKIRLLEMDLSFLELLLIQ